MLKKSINTSTYNYLNNLNRIYITDVTLSDGLQSFYKVLSSKNKAIIGKKIASLGIVNLEIGSTNYGTFSHLNDSLSIYSDMKKFNSNLNYFINTSNNLGIEKLMRNNIKDIVFVTSPSDTFNYKAYNCNTIDNLRNIDRMINNITNDAYLKIHINCINECPYEGQIHLDKIIGCIYYLYDLGFNEICLNDTLATLTKKNLNIILSNLDNDVIDRISIHLHRKKNNNNWKNIITCCLENNISSFDTSLLNLGGYEPINNKYEKTKNLNLKDLLLFMDEIGYLHNIKMDQIENVEIDVRKILLYS